MEILKKNGHAMIAYQVVDRTAGNWDVLMLNSDGGPQVRTRINGTPRIFYNMFPSSLGNNNIIDVDKQGTLRYF